MLNLTTRRALCAKPASALATSAGPHKDCREIYLSRQILQLAFENGMPITFGCDAHAPEEVGMNFAEAIQLARRVGYAEYRWFTRRERGIARF
jgi:histidinol-phosphatase (PHP family)